MRVMRQRAGEEQRATALELFFDLVFVFAVTQLSRYLLHHLTVQGAAQTLFLVLVAWWAWIYTTWMTNWAVEDNSQLRNANLVTPVPKPVPEATRELLGPIRERLGMDLAVETAVVDEDIPF
jgi:hypothetical protein